MSTLSNTCLGKDCGLYLGDNGDTLESFNQGSKNGVFSVTERLEEGQKDAGLPCS